MARKGLSVHLPEFPHVEELINGKLGERNLSPRSLGIGTGTHLSNVGAHNAQWSYVNLSGQDLNNVPVPHTLGEVPVSCEYVDHENSTTPATFLAVRPVNRSQWTATECRVAVSALSGNATGTLVRFRVWGV